MSSDVTSVNDLHPKLVAFDLERVRSENSCPQPRALFLGNPGPLRRKDNTVNQVLDKHGDQITFYNDVPHILHGLRNRHHHKDDDDRKVVIAACSRTHAPTLARRCLELLLVPPNPKHPSPNPIPAINYFDELEIYPGSKLQHFKRIHERTGIPYTEMLFFDDEKRNSEVEKLGVTFTHVPRGLDQRKFDEGLREWRRRQSSESTS